MITKETKEVTLIKMQNRQSRAEKNFCELIGQSCSFTKPYLDLVQIITNLQKWSYNEQKH